MEAVSYTHLDVYKRQAQQLGYTINERARILRKGTGNVVGVILPTVESRQYREFYYSLKYYVESNGYSTELFLTNNSPQVELEMIQKAKSVMVCGMIVITCLYRKENVYKQAGFAKVCFVERHPGFEADYFGFDYKLAGIQMAKKILNNGYKNVLVVTESEKYTNEAEYLKGFCSEIDESSYCNVKKITTDSVSYTHLDVYKRQIYRKPISFWDRQI